MTRARAFLLLLLVQVACAGVFVLDIVLSIFGFYPVPLAWTTRELMEMGAALGLLLGGVFGGMLVWRSFHDLRHAEARLSRASSAFLDMLTARFEEWELTAAERDVALFAIKGMNVQEIAQLRATSEGTVKAQTAAIYRKAGVTGRPQLLSLFIDDMMGGRAAQPRESSENSSPSKARLRA
jgi:DNA-binding CsgD family transcriptional regulator